MRMINKWKPSLGSDILKMIAIITMLIDHIAASFIVAAFLGKAETPYYWYRIYYVMRYIGRTAFPIFAFLLVEGFFHTHSRKKYLGRLVLFTLLSEIPFDMAFQGVLFYRDDQNVFCTLTIGFLVIWGMEELYKRYKTNRVMNSFLDAALILAGSFAAILLGTDYNAYGVLLIALFYFGKRAKLPRLLTCIAGYLLFLWEPYCFGGFLLILFYNGTRRKRGKGFQYFFYLFYPVHLLILGLIRVVFLVN